MRAILATIAATPSRDPEDDSAVDDVNVAAETCFQNDDEEGDGYEWGAGLGLEDLSSSSSSGRGGDSYGGHTLVVALGESWNAQQHQVVGSPPQYSLAYDEKCDGGGHSNVGQLQGRAERPSPGTEEVLPPAPTRNRYHGRPFKRLRGFGFDLGPSINTSTSTDSDNSRGLADVGVSSSISGCGTIPTEAPPLPVSPTATCSLATHASAASSPSPSVAPTSSPQSCLPTKDGVYCRLPTLGDAIGPQDNALQELSVTSDHTLASFHLALRDESGHTVYTDGWARARVAKNGSQGDMDGGQGAAGPGPVESAQVHKWPLKAMPEPLDVVDIDRDEGCDSTATSCFHCSS